MKLQEMERPRPFRKTAQSQVVKRLLEMTLPNPAPFKEIAMDFKAFFYDVPFGCWDVFSGRGNNLDGKRHAINGLQERR